LYKTDLTRKGHKPAGPTAARACVGKDCHKVIVADLMSEQRMKTMSELKGKCLCGAVTLEFEPAKPELEAQVAAMMAEEQS
jgi:hypothetical protein